MGRSHGFASTTTNYGALFRLAFATAPFLKNLTLLVTVTRRLIMQKARRHHEWLRPLVSVWFQDLFHSLIQGSFHLSLTVLVHYRSLRSILALADGPARFIQGFTCPALLRIPLSITLFTYTGLSPSMAPLSKGF